MTGRPLYESENDLQAEREIVDRFCNHSGLTAEKLGKFDLDFALFRNGQMVAIAEVKDRVGWKKEYGTIMLSTFKVQSLISYSEAIGVKAIFIVRVLGDVMWVLIERRSEPPKITWSGRQDRDDPLDMEPCWHIPFAEFKKIPQL